MDRTCDVCGKKYTAKTSKSLFCSGSCRQKAARQRGKSAPVDIAAKRNAAPRERNAPSRKRNAPADVAQVPPPRRRGPLEQSTFDSLAELGVDESPLGVSAIGMARMLDFVPMTGSAYASLNREWRFTAAAALSEGKVAADPIDQLARRRIDRRAGA